MPPKVCPNKACNGTSFGQDVQSGEYVCRDCGTVTDESNIVSEITFGESSAGAITVTGSFVGADQAHASSGGLHGHQGESRAQTIEKTRRRINAVAAKLQIQDHIAGNALGYFKLALQHNFVKGRKSHYVVSACLYLSCRLHETHHMLMDFAEAIFVNVFTIGSTYLQLIKCLGLSRIPIMEPHFFIPRFVSKLGLKQDASLVVNDATKLTQRMARDWLAIGRRPAGVAAACVLLAARMNNIRVSKAEIVQIAKIGESTVQRRLNEFSNTSAGGLAVDVFRATMIESSADPPSFIQHQEDNRKAIQKLEQERDAIDRGEGVGDDLLQMAKEIDESLAEVGRVLEAEGREGEEGDAESENNIEVIDKDIDKEKGKEKGKEKERGDKGKEKETRNEINNEATQLEPETNTTSEINTSTSSSKDKQQDELDLSDDENIFVEQDDDVIETPPPPPQKPKPTSTSTLAPPNSTRAQTFLQRYQAQKAAAIASALAAGNEDIDLSIIAGGIIGRVRENRGPTWISEVPDDPEDLADVDDDEVDACLLDEHETKIKTQVWMSMNKDYLLEQENKRLKMLADEAAGITKTHKKRKRNTNIKGRSSTYKLQDGSLPTASENTQQVLKQKAFSKKLDYQKLSFFLFDNKKKGTATPAINNPNE